MTGRPRVRAPHLHRRRPITARRAIAHTVQTTLAALTPTSRRVEVGVGILAGLVVVEAAVGVWTLL